MSFSPRIDNLMTALRWLPGIGPKSAQRLGFHLLQHDRERAKQLADAIIHAADEVQHCERCHTFCEIPVCTICQDSKRDPSLLCIVESPIDILSIEQTSSYRGYYFVLFGHLSPIDGIGPHELPLEKLQQQLNSGDIQEVILATNTTVEGEATAHYLAQLIKAKNIKTTRIAHGIPLGGELEYIDGNTLAQALRERRLI